MLIEIIPVVQIAIITVLMFVITLGIGFILNMLLKTTWFPLCCYLLLIVGIVAWFWHKDGGSILETIKGFMISDYAAAAGGFSGAWLSGNLIRTLRLKGFKMF